MSLIKRWFQDEPAPTAEEKAAAESFKQILKYGTDIGGHYKDVSDRLDIIHKEKRMAKETAEKAIIKQRGIKIKPLRGGGRNYCNWNCIYIRDYSDCGESPLGVCVTMMEYGSDNPEKDEPQNCFYCEKKFK